MGVGGSLEREETGVGVGDSNNPNNRVTLTEIMGSFSYKTRDLIKENGRKI
jgi:hypothetical protein